MSQTEPLLPCVVTSRCMQGGGGGAVGYCSRWHFCFISLLESHASVGCCQAWHKKTAWVCL